MVRQNMSDEERRRQTRRNLLLALLLGGIAVLTLIYSFMYLPDMLAGANVGQ